MFLTTVLCSVLILILILFWHYPKHKGKNKLPGPTPLPLIGNILQFEKQPHVTFIKWAKLYGPIYGIKLGLDNGIVVSDHKLIKELFNESASTNRPKDNPIWMEFTKGPYGVLNSSGSTWESQRKFCVKTLRNLGFAKASMETLILDELKTLLEWFRKQEGSPISGVRIFNAPVINSVWCLITGERCKWEEGKHAIFVAIDQFWKEFNTVATNGLFFAPVLRFVAPNFFRWNQYVKSVNTMLELLQKTISKHRETFDSTNLRDYIDHYLFEITKETDPNSSFYKDTGNANMAAGVFDLFLAGTETMSLTLSWTLLYLSEHQHIQLRLQKEIDNVVGTRLPSLLDRNKLPYSESVMSEILRISSIAPVGSPHGMKSDMVFHGYHLSKGATVFANMYAVHHDPKIWGDPESFRPERFLSEDGTKFVQNDALIPFSDGKRKCIGETFARDTLFLFLTGIFQKFNVLPDPNTKEKPDFEPEIGLVLGPKPFKIVVSPRKS